MNRTYSNRRLLSCGGLLLVGSVLLANAANAQPADREALKRQLQEMNLAAEPTRDAPARLFELMQQADVNKDGVLTKAELEATLESQFARIDRNGDGKANEDDAPKFAGRDRFTSRVSPLIAEQDQNGDGALTFAEFSVRSLSGFARMDDDGDGQVELDAIAARFTAAAPMEGG